jgi:hypothetical protein
LRYNAKRVGLFFKEGFYLHSERVLTMEKWLSYNELAWLEPIVAPPEEYAGETELYCKLIKEHALIETKTLPAGRQRD